MLYTIWIIMLVLGFLLLGTSIVLLFIFHVPDLLDELSGRKAKRQIRHLKELNLSTGSLEGISNGEVATDDIYQTISSGSLLSEEISVIQAKPEEIKEENSKKDIVLETSGSDIEDSTTSMDVVEGENPMVSDLDTEDSTTSMDVVEECLTLDSDTDDSTTSMDIVEEESTGYVSSEIEESEESTSFVDNSDVTNILSDVEQYNLKKRVVEIIEEQSSIREEIE